LRKLGAHPHFEIANSFSFSAIKTGNDTFLVFNLVSLKLETYDLEIINVNFHIRLVLNAPKLNAKV
jgi:hypothetical protein